MNKEIVISVIVIFIMYYLWVYASMLLIVIFFSSFGEKVNTHSTSS